MFQDSHAKERAIFVPKSKEITEDHKWDHSYIFY